MIDSKSVYKALIASFSKYINLRYNGDLCVGNIYLHEINVAGAIVNEKIRDRVGIRICKAHEILI